jgi:hypothetical protein
MSLLNTFSTLSFELINQFALTYKKIDSCYCVDPVFRNSSKLQIIIISTGISKAEIFI